MNWFVIEDLALIGMIGVLVYSVWMGLHWYLERSRRKAMMWLDISRAITAKTPEQIEKVLRSHNIFLDKHIKQALENRIQDLKVQIEISKTLKIQSKKNDKQHN